LWLQTVYWDRAIVVWIRALGGRSLAVLEFVSGRVDRGRVEIDILNMFMNTSRGSNVLVRESNSLTLPANTALVIWQNCVRWGCGQSGKKVRLRGRIDLQIFAR